MRRSVGIFFVYAVLSVCFAGSAFADNSFFDNFNSENFAIGKLNHVELNNWNIDVGSVDLIGNGFFDYYPANNLYLDLDGTTGAAATISTKASFDPGNYTLWFDLGGSTRSGLEVVTVSLGDYLETFTINADDPLVTYTRDVTLTSADNLVFRHEGGDNVGAILDNVELRGANVPEPASCLIFGSSIAALGFFRRRARS
jgi:hypothetical protein